MANIMQLRIHTQEKLSKQARTAIVLDVCSWLRELEAYEQSQSRIDITFICGSEEAPYAADSTEM